MTPRSVHPAERGPSEAPAHRLMGRFVELYNRDDARALYALFDERAQSQFSFEQFRQRLVLLRARLGHIEGFSYVQSDSPVVVDGVSLLSLTFLLRLTGGLAAGAQMRLAVTLDQSRIDAWSLTLQDGSTDGPLPPPKEIRPSQH